jgi:pimeloyl-ACP methyl ester carboxylesterase
MRKSLIAAGLAAVLVSVGAAQAQSAPEHVHKGRGHYEEVNGLRMYFEVHGKPTAKRPLVLLHGALSATGTSFGELLPKLAKTRQVISIEQQAHGHTPDINRPLRIPTMADDTVTLLRKIGVHKADFFGYSMGAGIALDIGVRHPDAVGKLVLAAVAHDLAGMHPGVNDGIQHIKPEDLHGSPFHEEYLRIAPRPQDFPRLLERVKDMSANQASWPESAIKNLTAHTLVVIGDSDIVQPEHAVKMFRLLGGGVPGDNVGLPNSQLAVLPGTTHVTLVSRANLLLPVIPAFLDR